MAPILDSLYEQELMTVFQDHGFVMDILLSYGPLEPLSLRATLQQLDMSFLLRTLINHWKN